MADFRRSLGLLLLLRLLLRIGIVNFVISIVVISAGIGIGKGVASQQPPVPREVSEKEALASRASPTCPPTPALRPARWRASVLPQARPRSAAL